MTLKNFLFTSESVSEGHPDKVCDQISDAILDAYLTVDPMARVAVETLATTNRVILAGEVRSTAPVKQDSLEAITREVVRDIGYEQPDFHWQHFDFSSFIHEQSPDIAAGVDREQGAGDQGIMFGFACRETEAYMPAPIYYTHLLLRRIAEARKQGDLKGLGPDAKSQITLEYIDGLPQRVAAIVISHQHQENVSLEEVRHMIQPYVEETLPKAWQSQECNLLVNPAGRFVVGGPDGDAGLTGRKIIVDTYGGFAPHGGGAFSGKDSTKVDRSAAYAARYLAKNVVASGLADKCLIQLSYAIGVSQPLSLYVNLFDTGKVDESVVANVLPRIMDLSPTGIRKHLNLTRPIFRKTATYGHFGRTPESDGSFSWEKTDLVDEILTQTGSHGKRLASV